MILRIRSGYGLFSRPIATRSRATLSGMSGQRTWTPYPHELPGVSSSGGGGPYVPLRGTTAQRPAAASVPFATYFDTTQDQQLVSDGVNWLNGFGPNSNLVPNVVAANAGDHATLSFNSTDWGGLISFFTGLTPAPGLQLTFTWNASTPNIQPRSVILQPSNDNAVHLVSPGGAVTPGLGVVVNNNGFFISTINTGAGGTPPASTRFDIFYVVVGGKP